MTENKRSAIVGAAAWAFMLLGGCHAARAAYDNLTLASMFSSPGFMLGLAGATLPVELPLLARLAAAHIRLVFIAYLLVSLGVCATGFGLLLRKAWALAAARRLFYSAAACCFAVFLVPGLLVPQPLIRDGVALAPEFNAAVGWMRIQLRFVTALLGPAFFLVARRCERPPIMGEFGLAERPARAGKL
jgi:hypothetical protein